MRFDYPHTTYGALTTCWPRANTNLLVSGDLRRMTYVSVAASMGSSLFSLIFSFICLWSLDHPVRLEACLLHMHFDCLSLPYNIDFRHSLNDPSSSTISVALPLFSEEPLHLHSLSQLARGHGWIKQLQARVGVERYAASSSGLHL